MTTHRIRNALLALLALTFLQGWATATVMEFDGHQRSFEMSVPATAPRPLPVVLVLHGAGGTSSQIRLYSRFDEIAQNQGVLVVYPQGLDRSWNDGRSVTGLTGKSNDADDVAFLMAVVDNLAHTGLADRHRLYVVGLSGGGMMALRLACELPERVAGFAVVAANIPVGLNCAPSRPVPAMFFHGSEDRYVPWNGGDIMRLANLDRGQVLSVDDTLALWRRIDGCSGEVKSEQVTWGKPFSRRLTTKRCSGAPVVHYVSEGGGHVWPGARQGPGGDALLGVGDHDLDATGLIWDFFKSLPPR